MGKILDKLIAPFKSAPAVAGEIVYDSSSGYLKYYNGSSSSVITLSPSGLGAGGFDSTFAAPTGSIAQTFSRYSATTNGATTSGTMRASLIWIPASTLLTSISHYSGSQAAGTPTNQWFALYDASRNLLRQTTNDTTTAWGTNTKKTLNLSSTYTTPAGSGAFYYIASLIAATTAPSLVTSDAIISSVANDGLVVGGPTTSTGLTTTAPASFTFGAAANVNTSYAIVS